MSIDKLHKNAVKFVVDYLNSFEDFCLERTNGLYLRASRTVEALAHQSMQSIDTVWKSVERDARARIRVYKMRNI
jgi:hypothetical protein